MAEQIKSATADVKAAMVKIQKLQKDLISLDFVIASSRIEDDTKEDIRGRLIEVIIASHGVLHSLRCALGENFILTKPGGNSENAAEQIAKIAQAVRDSLKELEDKNRKSRG